MKTFLKWFTETSFFPLTILLIGFVVMFFWEDTEDKLLGRLSFGLVFFVLLIGKYTYYKKNKAAIDEKFG
jgi:hypothetical protein